jgi:ribose transport system permease protein
MTGAAGAAGTPVRATGTPRGGSLGRVFREQPLIPLAALLVLLVALLQVASPGIIGPDWAATTIRAAVPLAILAAAQTLAMLTGGIDLSVGMIASAVAYVMATQATAQGPLVAILLAVLVGLAAGTVNGIGIGIFRVHPLIMTLGMSLVILGLLTVYQVRVVTTGVAVPEGVAWIGGGTSFSIPNNLLVFVPLAALILFALRASGYGRLLYAVGDNPIAARLSGVRSWQVLLVLYVICAVLAAIAGILVAGQLRTASLTLVERQVLPSVAAAVIGGTSILGGRGGYAGSIVGALILTVLTTLLTVLQMPEAIRQVLFGAIIVAVAAAYTRLTGET